MFVTNESGQPRSRSWSDPRTSTVDMPGFWELVTLAVLALLIFGPERLPKMARNAGRMIAKFRAEASATIDELKAAADLDEITGVADEFKATSRDIRGIGADIRRDFDLSADVRGDKDATPSLTSASAGGMTAAAPFDPDTP